MVNSSVERMKTVNMLNHSDYYTIEYAEEIVVEDNSKMMLNRRYIGDRISVKQVSYTVTANYPRHGYLLAISNKVGRNKTVKIIYEG